ncbi:MAG: TonB family protein [Acidobacteriales bacterium]|nr:TonB family protein [Terriglobales bacterium]
MPVPAQENLSENPPESVELSPPDHSRMLIALGILLLTLVLELAQNRHLLLASMPSHPKQSVARVNPPLVQPSVTSRAALPPVTTAPASAPVVPDITQPAAKPAPETLVLPPISVEVIATPRVPASTPAVTGSAPAAKKTVQGSTADLNSHSAKTSAQSSPTAKKPATTAENKTPKPHPASPVHSTGESASTPSASAASHSTSSPSHADAGSQAAAKPVVPKPRVAHADVHMSAGSAQVVSHPVNPSYPLEAKQKNVQGTVVMHATVGKDGTVQSLKVVSGPAALAGAASDAVKQWRFKPAFHAGEPAESEAQITVNFSIAQAAAANGVSDQKKQAP